MDVRRSNYKQSDHNGVRSVLKHILCHEIVLIVRQQAGVCKIESNIGKSADFVRVISALSQLYC